MTQENIRTAPENICAIVTGAGSGIGRAAALRLGTAGYPVAVLDIQSDNAEQTVALLAKRGVRAQSFTVDVTQEDQVASVVASAEAALGPVGILINVAGIQTPNVRLRDLSLEEWDRVMGVNLNGTFLCCRAALPSMLTLGWGRIVNTSSVLGMRGRAGTGAYAISKASIIGLTKSIALEVVGHGITANAVLPSMVDTPLVRQNSTEAQVVARGKALTIGRLAEADEIASAIAYLASPDASYISGANLVISGGTFIIA